jgi:hypothetical protein
MKRLIVIVLMLGVVLWPAPAAAAPLDTWRVLHIGLQSATSVDTDGDGTVNTWQDCATLADGTQRCKRIEDSTLYKKWKRDIGCFDNKVEAWSGNQINILQRSTFINTPAHLNNNPYSFAWTDYSPTDGVERTWAQQYDFESYDVIMVWTAYTQATGWDGGTWNGVTGGYAYPGLYGVSGDCKGGWPTGVPEHEFVHTVTGLYVAEGWPVCGTYEYPYGLYGEWIGHHMILTNSFPPTTCSSGIVSTGIPKEAWASGSWMDLR